MIFSDGEIVQGRYQIRKQICGGTFGTTYHALDTQSGREVVIKVSDGGNDEERQSLEEELRILEKLNHPRLPKVFDWFWVNNQQRICMVMEYIPGTDVADYVNERRQKRCSPVMELPQVIGWICQVLDILAYLHRRQPDPIIHRDVKPENLRIHQDTGHIYLLDFGIAKSSNRTRMIGYGTPPYAPPEQYGGKGKTTPATDIYAVGVTMYVLLTGQDPPESLELERRKETLVLTHRYNPAIPAELEKIIHQAMHLDPAERYPDAQTMLKALEEVEIVRNLNQSGDYVTRLLSEEEDLDLLKEHITRLEEENKQLQKELEECAEERRNLHKLHQQSGRWEYFSTKVTDLLYGKKTTQSLRERNTYLEVENGSLNQALDTCKKELERKQAHNESLEHGLEKCNQERQKLEKAHKHLKDEYTICQDERRKHRADRQECLSKISQYAGEPVIPSEQCYTALEKLDIQPSSLLTHIKQFRNWVVLGGLFVFFLSALLLAFYTLLPPSVCPLAALGMQVAILAWGGVLTWHLPRWISGMMWGIVVPAGSGLTINVVALKMAEIISLSTLHWVFFWGYLPIMFILVVVTVVWRKGKGW